MFRRKTLDRLEAPDSTDALLVVVTPRAVMTLMAIAAVAIVAIGWSIVGSIPVTVEGSGVLLKPGTVKPVQSSGSGRITRILVQSGDRVRAGQVIAMVDQPELERQLEQFTAQYLLKREFAEKQIALARRELELQRGVLAEMISNTDEGILALRQLQPRLAERRTSLVAVQRQNMQNTLGRLRQRLELEEKRLESTEELAQRGIVNNPTRLAVLGTVTGIAANLAQMETQLKQTEVSEADSEQRDLMLRRELDTRETDRMNLDVRIQQAERTFDATVQQHEEALGGIAASIRSTRERLRRQSQVVSPYDGTVLELIGAEGQLVGSGERLAMLQLDVQSPFHRLELSRDAAKGTFRLVVNGYRTEPIAFDAATETVVAALRATPPLKEALAIIGRGSLPGSPVDIRIDLGTDAPGSLQIDMEDRGLSTASDMPSFATLGDLGSIVKDVDMIHACFFPIGTGKRLAPDMEMRISPSSVERQRFGSIVGKLTSVSSFPMTGEGILNLVGNTKLAQTLLEEGGGIMGEARLEKDPASPTGLKWTSRGPDNPVTPGTTTSCRVTVERRKPISFVIPLLREWLLGEVSKPTAADAKKSAKP